MNAEQLWKLLPDAAQRRTSVENVADVLNVLATQEVTGEDAVLRAASQMITHGNAVSGFSIEGQVRSREWVAQRLLDIITHAPDLSAVVSINNVLKLRALFESGRLTPNNEAGWRKALEVWNYRDAGELS